MKNVTLGGEEFRIQAAMLAIGADGAPLAQPASAANVAAATVQLAALNAAIGVAADAPGANTVIGQLKQIVINTTAP